MCPPVPATLFAPARTTFGARSVRRTMTARCHLGGAMFVKNNDTKKSSQRLEHQVMIHLRSPTTAIATCSTDNDNGVAKSLAKRRNLARKVHRHFLLVLQPRLLALYSTAI